MPTPSTDGVVEGAGVLNIGVELITTTDDVITIVGDGVVEVHVVELVLSVEKATNVMMPVEVELGGGAKVDVSAVATSPVLLLVDGTTVTPRTEGNVDDAVNVMITGGVVVDTAGSVDVAVVEVLLVQEDDDTTSVVIPVEVELGGLTKVVVSAVATSPVLVLLEGTTVTPRTDGVVENVVNVMIIGGAVVEINVAVAGMVLLLLQEDDEDNDDAEETKFGVTIGAIEVTLAISVVELRSEIMVDTVELMSLVTAESVADEIVASSAGYGQVLKKKSRKKLKPRCSELLHRTVT
jgi:hypothetical protein